jgi:hypothetical protein
MRRREPCERPSAKAQLQKQNGGGKQQRNTVHLRELGYLVLNLKTVTSCMGFCGVTTVDGKFG